MNVRGALGALNRLDPVHWLHKGRRAVIIHRCLFWCSLVLTVVVMATPLRDSVWIIMGISWWTVWFQHIGSAQAAIATEKAEEAGNV